MTSAWKIDDPEWMRARKALWKLLKPRYIEVFFPDDDRAQIAAKQNYFLTGEMPEKAHNFSPRSEQPLLRAWEKILLHPAPTREEILKFIEEGGHKNLPQVAAFWKWFIAGASHAYFGSEHGCCGGNEVLIMRVVMPKAFDVDAWRAEGAWRNSNLTRLFLSPIDAHELLMSWGGSYLLIYSGNPYAPITMFIDYWRSCLPYIEEKYFSDENKKLAARMFFRQIRYFREPRGMQGIDSLAKRFRDRLYAILQAGTGNAIFDQLWSESMETVDDFLAGELRAVFTSVPRPDALRAIVEAWCEVMAVTHIFDAQRIELVDIGHLLWWGFAEKLGYPLKPGHQYGLDAAYGAPAPAYRYRFEGEFKHENGKKIIVAIDLFQLIRPEGMDFDPLLPQVLIVPKQFIFNRDLEGKDYVVLCERQVAYYLHQKDSITCALPTAGDIFKEAELASFGTEHVWPLREYLAEGYRTATEKMVRPWKAKRSDLNLEEFQRVVSAGI